MESYVEQLIMEDVATIANKRVKTQRIRALREYYSNPNYCQCCGSLIQVNKGMKVSDVKPKKFCNRSCSATYNNQVVLKDRMKSIAESCSNEEFLAAYNASDNYVQLGMAIGYTFVNSDVSKKLKRRISQLGLEEYESCIRNPIEGLTKGELMRNRTNWQSWRSSIQKGARAIYRNSSKPKSCAVCGYDKTYEVAHIKSVSDFSDDALISEINHVDNLVALCPNHHWEFDHIGLDLSEYQL